MADDIPIYDDLIEVNGALVPRSSIDVSNIMPLNVFGRNQLYKPKTQGKKNKENMEKLLKVLEETGSIVMACKAVDIKPSTLRYWRKQDPLYDQACSDARDLSNANLETNLIDRATNGWEEDVYHNGSIVGEQKKYDNNLSLKMLERRNREEYAPPDTKRVELTGKDGGPIRTLNLDVTVSLEELARHESSALVEEYKARLEKKKK